MAYKKIQCEKENCQYGTSHCCFGEYDPDSIKGHKLKERHKCKRNKKELVYTTISPPAIATQK